MARIARSSLGIVLGAFSASVSLLLSGCGIGTAAGPASYALPKVTGMVHGGAAPIWHGRVRMYLTSTAAAGATYGSQPTEIDATSDTGGSGGVYTDGYGAFTIDNVTYPYTCTSGQFAYITITGGDTGGLTDGSGATTPVPNNNSVQMAALGSCSNLSSQSAQSATHVFLSEVSTVAAAYALSNFITEDPSHLGDGDQRVWVNAPATNGDATGTCTTSSNVTTSCAAAGLAHAFANATSLVSAVNFGSTMPSGAANSTLSTNASAAIPTALINTLGNISSACVNSTGTTGTNSGTSNDGTACGKLFSYTTFPSSLTTANNLPATPTDSLMAMVNLAKHPAGYNGSAVGNLFNLVPPQTSFAPSLALKPTDYSLAIFYPSSTVSGTATAFVSPQYVALDASDTAYILDKATSAKIFSISANGTGNWVSTQAAAYTNPKQLATDTLSHVWMSEDETGSTTTDRNILGLKTSDGTSFQNINTGSTYNWALAVDRSNNIWLGRSANVPTLYEYVQANSYAASANSGAFTIGQNTLSIALDSNQNVWGITNTSSGTTGKYWVYANDYGTTATISAALPGASTANYNGYGVAIDGSGGAFTTQHSATGYITINRTSGKATTANTATANTSGGASPGYIQVDGNSLAWYPLSTGQTVYAIDSSGNQNFALIPCYISSPASGTTCATSGSTPAAFQYPFSLAIDSAGSIWVAYSRSTAPGVAEIIGTATPIWPAMSYGHPGVQP